MLTWHAFWLMEYAIVVVMVIMVGAIAGSMEARLWYNLVFLWSYGLCLELCPTFSLVYAWWVVRPLFFTSMLEIYRQYCKKNCKIVQKYYNDEVPDYDPWHVLFSTCCTIFCFRWLTNTWKISLSPFSDSFPFLSYLPQCHDHVLFLMGFVLVDLVFIIHDKVHINWKWRREGEGSVA